MVAVQEAYGRPMASPGPRRSIPLCDVFNETYPDAEFIVMGVEERLALIHAPNLSVQATELFSMALRAARFLHSHADARA
jgi:hypothetical protein